MKLEMGKNFIEKLFLAKGKPIEIKICYCISLLFIPLLFFQMTSDKLISFPKRAGIFSAEAIDNLDISLSTKAISVPDLTVIRDHNIYIILIRLSGGRVN